MQEPIYVDSLSEADFAVEKLGSRVSDGEPYIQLHYDENMSAVDRARMDSRIRREAGSGYSLVELDEHTRSLELQRRRIQRVWDNVVRG